MTFETGNDAKDNDMTGVPVEGTSDTGQGQ